MKILSLSREPFHRVRYINAGRRGKAESAYLPFFEGEVEGLPSGVDALVCASDLQGVVPSWRNEGANTLLGVHLADELLELAERGVLPYPERTGIVLAGDLYSAPGGDVRGASGDVREVWEAFAASFRWVTGVQGNHDRFGTARERARLESHEGVNLINGDVIELDGMRFGGVGEIMGDPRKAGRRSEGDFLAAVELVVGERPDLVVLHQGPDGKREQRGSAEVGEVVSDLQGLVVCGHVHWPTPLCTPQNGPQVLNVDSRVVVLRSASTPSSQRSPIKPDGD
ncbi:MAG: metallophosphoesterase [Myxococcota bacterium]